MRHITTISWEEIRDVWSTDLWPGRKSPIEPVSSMLYLGGYDTNIKNYQPTFFGVFENDTLIAVNSGVKTSPDQYRTRGLYVYPEYRSKGYAQAVLESAIEQARNEKCQVIWTVPRKSALSTYNKVGFTRTSSWFDEGMEFGPNCYAVCVIGEQDDR